MTNRANQNPYCVGKSLEPMNLVPELEPIPLVEKALQVLPGPVRRGHRQAGKVR